MKSTILLVLCCILLCGCQKTGEQISAAPESYPVIAAIPAGNQETIRQFSLTDSTAGVIAACGDRLYLCTGNETASTLSALHSGTMELLYTAELDTPCSGDDSFLYAGEDGICLCRPAEKVLYFFDSQLTQEAAYQLPAGMIGKPCLSRDRNTLYYCAEDGIRALDLPTGISRKLTEVTGRYSRVQSIGGGTVLCCTGTRSNGEPGSLFLSPEDGRILKETEAFPVFQTWGDQWFGLHSLESRQEILIGGQDNSLHTLVVGPERAFLAFLPEENLLVTYSCFREGDSVILDCFDLTSGRRIASERLAGIGIPEGIVSSGPGEISLLAYDANHSPVLLQWQLALSPADDSRCYRFRRYTEDAPDEAGLRRCQATARTLGAKYGIEIALYREAAESAPWDYRMEPEYLVPETELELEKLDMLLQFFPEGFLDTLTESIGPIRICLVRSITGLQNTGGLNHADGLQFRQEDTNCIALAVGTATQYNLFHELSHIIDSQVINQCRNYDNWEDWNPPEFRYDYDYAANETRDGSEYLQEETRAFIDTYAMSFPAEDRARILEFAVNDGNESCFRSPIMQEKLKQICIAIRKAFHLTKSPEKFRWEQYLENSLAYKEWA